MLINLVTAWEWPFGERPVSYGPYHLICLGIMFIVLFLVCGLVGRKHDKKKDDIVIFSFGAMLVSLEIYKQIFYTLDAGYYQWHAFPFQFCSVPMFVAFIAPLLKEGKVKDALYKFLGYFGLLAGIAVMAYPGNCFGTSYLVILLHTMIWHASMVIMGVYIQYSKRYYKNGIKDLLGGFIVFLVIVSIAFTANIIGYHLFFKTDMNTYGQQLNLFYISPYYSCSLPILSIIQTKVPYPVFLLCYFLAFFLGISLLLGIAKGISLVVSLFKSLKKKKEEKLVSE